METRDPSRTHRLVPGVAAVVVLGLLAASLVIVLGLPRWVPGVSDCTTTVGSRTVELTTRQAERAAARAATAVRREQPLRAASGAVAGVLEVPDRDARAVAAALTGRRAHAFTCTHGGAGEQESDRLSAAGLTARATTLRRDVEAAFGEQVLGGFAPGGVSTGHMPGSAHYEGRAVDVFFRPLTSQQRVRGWAVAQYAVAHADRLAVDTVIFDGRIWTARRAAQGWRSYAPDTSGRTAAEAAILEHRDHVHIDVAD